MIHNQGEYFPEWKNIRVICQNYSKDIKTNNLNDIKKILANGTISYFIPKGEDVCVNCFVFFDYRKDLKNFLKILEENKWVERYD